MVVDREKIERLEKELEEARREPAGDTIDAQALHALLAAYFAALASLQAEPYPLPRSGLNALVYWQEYFANPDHLLPQRPFMRGRIYS